MNYPLLRNFSVDPLITKFLIDKYESYRNSNPMTWQENTSFNNNEKNSGYQTPNLHKWQDEEFQTFLNNGLSKFVSEQLGTDKFSYFWVHYLEYENGGGMDIHKHWHNEDFVLFLYLSTCNSGHTVFYLNDYNQEHMERTCIRVQPIKSTGTCFSSLLSHKGEFTYENKKIFVVGLKLNP